MLKLINMSDKVTIADNQQGSLKPLAKDPSETTRQAPYCVKDLPNKDGDIVHALWRHREIHEQGTGRGTCPWIISFLFKFFSASWKISVGMS